MIVYRAPDGGSAVQLHASNGTVWLTYYQMADLYDTTSENIIQIVKRVLADGEVDESTANSELVVRREGVRQVRREIKIFNLDMILAVGYRVTTPRAVMFRQWATTVLKEYLVKGFALDDERLKNPDGSDDYFEEVVRRIRAIRASEKRFYQKARDLFAQTSADYRASSDLAQTFFATIQNKLLFAVTGHTAAELISARIDASSPSFGLTNWPTEHPRKLDATVAKNYLTEGELASLDRLVEQFLAFAEGQAERRLATTMEQWVAVTDRLLAANSYPLLDGPGAVSHEAIEALVDQRWAPFAERRRIRDKRDALELEADDLTRLWELERDVGHA
jgi:hypothetical protein